MKIEVAIFDWNGTLIDDAKHHFLVVSDLLKKFGLRQPPIDELKNIYCLPYMKFYRKVGITKKMATKEKLDKLYDTFYEERRKKNPVKLFPRTKKTLIWLRERCMQTIIVSSYPRGALKRILQVKKLDSLFDYILDGVYYKEIVLQQLIEKLNINPKSAFYLDDRTEGVLAAKKVGLIAGGFLKGWHAKEKIIEANPDFAIENLWELTKIID